MFALSLESAKDLAIGAVVVFLALSALSAWVIKHAITKLLAVVITAGLAFGAWSQRTNLENCAERATAGATAGAPVTCTFFGSEINIPAP